MLRSRGARRGQTAIEVLFIMGVVLAGVVVVLPVYTHQSDDSVLLTAVRDASSQAAAYIDTGVVSDDSKFAPLNPVITDYTGYRSIGFRFVGLKVVSENSTDVVILIKFDHSLSPDSSRDSKIAGSIGNFLKGYLRGLASFYWKGGHLYQGGRLISFNVTVGETWEVVK